MYKKCSKHHIFFPKENPIIESNGDNFYRNKTSNDGLFPYCKRCSIMKSDKWNRENKEKRKEIMKKEDSKQSTRDRMTKWNKIRKENGYFESWRQSNKDKISKYNKERKEHRTHEITEKEWIKCLSFFDNSCAYCGMTMEEHKEKFNQSLHREHVDDEGSNFIDNCIPSCKSCNSSKRKNGIEVFFERSDRFTEERYMKIFEWLSYITE